MTKQAHVSAGRNYAGPWRRTPGRVLGTALVRFYQLTLSGFIGNSCRHLPTCSEYGYEAIARHGLLAGSWLALRRVARCGPFGSWGFDPVPPTLARGCACSTDDGLALCEAAHDADSMREVAVAHKFEIFKDKAGEFRVRFKFNSEVMFSTEGYKSKASAENAIASIKKNGPEAPIDDTTTA